MSENSGIQVREGNTMGVLRGAVLENARRAMLEAGVQAQAELRRTLSVPSANGHSAPGDPPRMDTGNLSRSMTLAITQTANGAQLSLGDLEGRAPYAAALEHGTRRMAARPFMGGRSARLAASWAAKFSALLKNLGRDA